jgi:hypothetical protein
MPQKQFAPNGFRNLAETSHALQFPPLSPSAKRNHHRNRQAEAGPE